MHLDNRIAGSFIKFGNPLYILVKKEGTCGSTSITTRGLKQCMIVYISKRNGISFTANSSKKKFAFGIPLTTTIYGNCLKLNPNFKYIY